MPYKRRAAPRRRRRRNPMGTKPQFMPRSLAFKRRNQVSTVTKYFKANGICQPDLDGRIKKVWRTGDLADDPPNGFVYMKGLYDQYKCLAIQMKIFPANVGIEPDTVLFGTNALFRGNSIVWSDQREEALIQIPNDISEIISEGSAKMINSRRPYGRTLYRPRGHPGWGSTVEITAEPDKWLGDIFLLTIAATPYVPPAVAPTLFYWTLSYKIVFRGQRTPP